MRTLVALPKRIVQCISRITYVRLRISGILAHFVLAISFFLISAAGQGGPAGVSVTAIDNGFPTMTIAAHNFTGGAVTLYSATNAIQLTNSALMQVVSTKLASRDTVTY